MADVPIRRDVDLIALREALEASWSPPTSIDLTW